MSYDGVSIIIYTNNSSTEAYVGTVIEIYAGYGYWAIDVAAGSVGSSAATRPNNNDVYV